MKQLKDMVDLVCNNDQCVVLKVKPDSKMDLICLGCFNGDEELFRVTKRGGEGAPQHSTVTIFSKSGEYIWHDAMRDDEYSDLMRTKVKLIYDCIRKGFNIKIHAAI